MNENPLDVYQETIFHSLLKATDVAEILNISRAMAYRLMQTGQIPTVCIGKARRIRPIDLHNYINASLKPAQS